MGRGRGGEGEGGGKREKEVLRNFAKFGKPLGEPLGENRRIVNERSKTCPIFFLSSFFSLPPSLPVPTHEHEHDTAMRFRRCFR
jgi:hypothetical protein